MCDVRIHKKNEVYIKLECESHILYELQEYFTFEVPGAKFMPQMPLERRPGINKQRTFLVRQ